MTNTLKQFIKFGIIGASGLGVGLGTINIMMLFDTGFVAANILAFIIAATWNFFLNRKFTFGSDSNKSLVKQWIQFLASCSLGAAANWAISFSLYYSIPHLEKHYNIPALIGVTVGCIANFMCSKYLVFSTNAIQDA